MVKPLAAQLAAVIACPNAVFALNGAKVAHALSQVVHFNTGDEARHHAEQVRHVDALLVDVLHNRAFVELAVDDFAGDLAHGFAFGEFNGRFAELFDGGSVADLDVVFKEGIDVAAHRVVRHAVGRSATGNVVAEREGVDGHDAVFFNAERHAALGEVDVLDRRVHEGEVGDGVVFLAVQSKTVFTLEDPAIRGVLRIPATILDGRNGGVRYDER